MSCAQVLSGYTDDCESVFVGGNARKIYLAPLANVEAFVVNANVVSSITGASFSAYDLKKNNVSFSATWQFGDVEYSENALSGTIIGISTEANIQVQELLKAGVVACWRDNNGRYWVIGLENGAELTAVTATSGAGKTDASGIEFTLTAYERHLPYELSATAAAEIFK